MPIRGTRNARRLDENVRSAGVTLTRSDLDRIREILPSGGHGARYGGSTPK